MFSIMKYSEIRKLEAFLGVNDLSDLRDGANYSQPPPPSSKEKSEKRVLFVLRNDYPDWDKVLQFPLKNFQS